MATDTRTAAIWVRSNKVVKSIVSGNPGRVEAPHQERQAVLDASERLVAEFLGSKWQIVGVSAGGESNTDILLLEEWSL